MNRPLRIGLLCDHPTVPTYLFRALRKLRDAGKVEIVLVCLNQRSTSSTWRQKLPKVGRAVSELFFKKLSRTAPVARQHPLAELAPDVDVIPIEPRSTQFSDRFEPADLDRVREYDCDFLIRNGFKILRGGVLSVARHGVLSFHHGDNLVNRGGPPMYWEFAERWDNAGAILQLLTEELDGGRVLDRGYSDLVPWDYWRSHNNLTEACVSMLYRFLDSFEPDSLSENPWTDRLYDRRLYKSPPNWLGLWHVVSFLVYLLWATSRKSTHKEKWRLYLGPFGGPIRRYQELAPPKGEFWADPFLYSHGDEHCIYFERYVYQDGIGTLGVLQVDKQLKVHSESEVDIGEDCHLSFPNVLTIRDQLYMLPEAAGSGDLSLYRCVRFPDRFEKACVLLSGVSCVDSSMIEHEGRWWLFTTHSVLGEKSTVELQLYSAADPLGGSWERHPSSPLAIDVRCGRNAGQLFHRDGKLFRVAQDGTRRYGRRMAVYEVILLTEQHYQERFVRYIEPRWRSGINRCHTLNVSGDLAVLDAAGEVFRPFL